MSEIIQPKPGTKSLKPLGLNSNQPSIAVVGTWTAARARNAIDANDLGQFTFILQLQRSMTRDARVMGARLQRIATPLDQELRVEPIEGKSASNYSPTGRLCKEIEALFEDGGPLAYPIRAHWEGELADFGLSISSVHWQPSPGGAEWMPVVEPWPLDATRLDPLTGQLFALHEGGEEPIVPGNGRWTMVRASLLFPWLEGSVRSAVEPWLGRAYSNRDASRFSESAGQNPLVGTVPIQDDEKETAQFIDDVKGLSTGKLGTVVREGYKVERVNSNAEQADIFETNEARCARDAAIAYLGQDGTAAKGTTGTYGAVEVLNGVRYDLVQRDCRALCGGQNDVIAPYLFYNRGSTDASCVAYYNVPDPQETARMATEHEQARKDREAFLKEVGSVKGPLTKELVLEIAEAYCVAISEEYAEALAMKPATPPPPPIPLAEEP